MAKQDKQEKQPTFEQGLEKLELIVDQLETGNLPLSESFAAYETGIKLLKLLESELQQSEAKIQLLTKDGVQELNTDNA